MSRAQRKADAIKALANAKSIMIHRAHEDEIILYSPSCEVEVMKNAETAMKRGAAVSRNGVREWIHFEELHPVVWHSDGNRSRHEIARYKKDDATGVITRTVDKQIWRVVSD